MMPSVSVVIPAHNEESIIKKTVLNILEVLNKVKKLKYEILVCNDHSTDNTLDIARRLSKRFNEIGVVSNTSKPGFGNVMRFGFEKAKHAYLVPMMADLCDNPKTLLEMIKKAEEGYDVIVGSRYIRGGGKKNVQNHFKSFCSWGVGWLGYHVQGIATHDTTNAFKMMRKTAVSSVKLTSNTFDISLELTVKLHKKGYKITEVPTVWTDRSEGFSKFKVFKVMKKYVRWVVKKVN